MSRKRSKNHEGLPARWRYLHGAYRYQVPPGQEHRWDGKQTFTLGRTLSEAYRVWADRIAQPVSNITTVADAIERYLLEVVPKKAPSTQVTDRRRLAVVAQRFGHAHVRPGPQSIKPKHVYAYVSGNTHRLTSAHREVELLSHLFTMLVNWGEISEHPFKGASQVRFDHGLTPQPATRYVEDWEVLELLTLEPKQAHRAWGLRMVQAYVRVKLLTGLRKTDLLWLPAPSFNDEGLRVHPSKTRHTTGVKQVFQWSPDLRTACELALAARPVDIAPWLFVSSHGRPLITDADASGPFDRIWNRVMARALKETKLETRFAERDLRAKVATDAESLERARELLGHADTRITKRTYMRRAQVIAPAKGVRS